MRYKPTIYDLIVSHLLSAKSSYRQKKVLWELVKKKSYSKQEYYLGVSRLTRRGSIEKKDDGYTLTTKGRREYENPYRLMRKIAKPTRKIIVIFDVPEKKKKIREWLRFQLKWWDFKMVQKSVWVGNGPLPSEFKKRLKNLGIEKSVLIFGIKSFK